MVFESLLIFVEKNLSTFSLLWKLCGYTRLVETFENLIMRKPNDFI